MRDLKIKPGMDTPKAKQKNPAPKDAESILKKHMDERQTEKEPENRDPVHYANMVRGLVLLYSLLGVFGLFLGDVLMTIFDPRIRLTGKSGDTR